MSIQISKDEYVRLIRIEAGMELLHIYYNSEEFPDKKLTQKLLGQLLIGLPFSTPDAPETESGWHE